MSSPDCFVTLSATLGQEELPHCAAGAATLQSMSCTEWCFLRYLEMQEVVLVLR